MSLNRLLQRESTVVDFEEQISFKIKAFNRQKIKRVLNKNQDLFFNESHFVRCAVNRYLREFNEQGRFKRLE